MIGRLSRLPSGRKRELSFASTYAALTRQRGLFPPGMWLRYSCGPHAIGEILPPARSFLGRSQRPATGVCRFRKITKPIFRLSPAAAGSTGPGKGIARAPSLLFLW
jgi:hypothetical protein